MHKIKGTTTTHAFTNETTCTRHYFAHYATHEETFIATSSIIKKHASAVINYYALISKIQTLRRLAEPGRASRCHRGGGRRRRCVLRLAQFQVKQSLYRSYNTARCSAKAQGSDEVVPASNHFLDYANRPLEPGNIIVLNEHNRADFQSTSLLEVADKRRQLGEIRL